MECADPDASTQQTTKLVDILTSRVHLGEDAAGSSGNRLSRFGGRDAAAGALEHGGSELGFELSDLMRKR